MTATAHLLVMRAIVAQLRARPGYRDPVATTDDVPVYLGWQVHQHGDVVTDAVVIGWTDRESPSSIGRTAQDPAAMAASNRPRAEAGEIVCRISASSGDLALTAHEATLVNAYARLDDVDAVIRGAVGGPALGLVPGTCSSLVVQLKSIDAVLPGDDNGPTCSIEFTLAYAARV